MTKGFYTFNLLFGQKQQCSWRFLQFLEWKLWVSVHDVDFIQSCCPFSWCANNSGLDCSLNLHYASRANLATAQFIKWNGEKKWKARISSKQTFFFPSFLSLFAQRFACKDLTLTLMSVLSGLSEPDIFPHCTFSVRDTSPIFVVHDLNPNDRSCVLQSVLISSPNVDDFTRQAVRSFRRM